jgi:hypothetical protein
MKEIIEYLDNEINEVDNYINDLFEQYPELIHKAKELENGKYRFYITEKEHKKFNTPQFELYQFVHLHTHLTHITEDIEQICNGFPSELIREEFPYHPSSILIALRYSIVGLNKHIEHMQYEGCYSFDQIDKQLKHKRILIDIRESFIKSFFPKIE